MKTKITILFLLAIIGLSVKSQVPQFLGVTYWGGNVGQGTLFRVNANGGNFQVLCNFGNPFCFWYPNSTPIKATNGNIFGLTLGNGMCNGRIYNYNILTDSMIVQNFPIESTSSLIQGSDGNLYYSGAAIVDVDNNIYKYNISTNSLVNLHHWDTSVISLGNGPRGALLEASNGKFYGGTSERGLFDYGVIYCYDNTTNTYSVVHNFDSINGKINCGALIQASNGLLYGNTLEGGTYNSGVIYSFDITSNTYNVLYHFQNSSPSEDMIQANNGKLYGTASGGSLGYGVIYSFDITSNTYSVIYNFDSISGGSPVGHLLQASDGKLYGKTSMGGDSAYYGVIYSYDINTNSYSVIHNFDWSNGNWPNTGSGLIELSPNSACAASFTLTPDTALHHYIAYNTATGTGPLHYYWSWGDNTSDTIPYPSHTYADTGFYTICLTIMDSTGCSSSYCDSSYHVLRTTNTMAYVNVIQGFTGIKNIPSQPFTVSVYPNPANNTINIHQSFTSPNELVIITDILGHEVYKAPLMAIDNTIELTKWSSGVYFYEVKMRPDGSGESIRGKFIKQ
ncbi:MAG: choice-of-anchor tandem repeat GloVer-containing protein [Bacteroidota bacterium]